MSSGEGEIRQRLVEANLIDCIVALPTQLFYTTQIPVTLWFLAKNKANGTGQAGRTLRDRTGEVLFIDARELGRMEDRTHRTLDPEDRAKIAGTYHAWRGDAEPGAAAYADELGFCKAAPLTTVKEHRYVLTPGRYVGAPESEAPDEPYAEAVARLTAELEEQMREASALDGDLKNALSMLTDAV